MEPIAVFITSILTMTMTHALVLITPFLKPVVDVILVGIDPAPWQDGGPDERCDGGLFYVS
jgi:hypothetical protein